MTHRANNVTASPSHIRQGGCEGRRLSVHDSIIMRRSNQGIAMETLGDQFFRWTIIEQRPTMNWRLALCTISEP